MKKILVMYVCWSVGSKEGKPIAMASIIFVHAIITKFNNLLMNKYLISRVLGSNNSDESHRSCVKLD